MLVSRIVAIVATALLLLVGQPAVAAAQGLQLEVEPTTGPPGSTITVVGTGWSHEDYAQGVRISFERNYGNGVLERYAEDTVVRPNDQGNFRFTTTIPTTAQAGEVYSISALIGNGSGSRANFTVTAGTGSTGSAACEITVLGLHGLDEDEDSRILASAFAQLRQRFDQEGIRATFISIPYPTVTRAELLAFINVLDRNPVLRNGDHLSEYAQRAASRCHPARLVLIGYSLGAWIIDEWIRDAEPALAEKIVGIVTYGDPQWDSPGTGAGGLARHGLVGNQGLALKPYRPQPPLTARFTGYCANGDPICGGGYGPTSHDHAKQWADAIAPGAGTHGSYDQGATAMGADWLVPLVAR